MLSPTRTVISSGTVIVTSPRGGAATGSAGTVARGVAGGCGGVASSPAGANIASASARCSGVSGCSLTNFTIRLIRMPSLTKPPRSRCSGAGTLAWCSATGSHWSLNASEPEEPGSVSAV
jgi:membrane associated rhomboid family serine protease